MLHAEINTGYLVAIWIGVALVLLTGIIVGGISGVTSGSVLGGLAGALAGAFVMFVIYGAIFTGVNWPPLDAANHTYTPISFQVETNSSRFMGDGNGGTNQLFALQDKAGNTYKCDDTRCSVLKTGQWVTLMCEKEFQTNGAQGYSCNFGKYGKNEVTG